MKSSNPLVRMAASATTTWLIGIVSLLIVAFEVIGSSKPAAPLTLPALDVPQASQSYQQSTPEAAGKGRKRHDADISAVAATGIRG